jgi:uncharacterized protein YkwD
MAASVRQTLAPSAEAERAQQVLAANAKLVSQFDPREVEGMTLLNQIRMIAGLPPLAFDPKLAAAARGHSADMARLGFFSHESPVEGRKTFQERAKLAETTASGENIYQGSSTATAALKAWFLSPGHHKNMFASHTRQGLGRSGNVWTHLFGK